MTPETFETEFVAYNEFRAAAGARRVTRREFARTVKTHNEVCAITPEQSKAFWELVDGAFSGDEATEGLGGP